MIGAETTVLFKQTFQTLKKLYIGQHIREEGILRYTLAEHQCIPNFNEVTPDFLITEDKFGFYVKDKRA